MLCGVRGSRIRALATGAGDAWATKSVLRQKYADRSGKSGANGAARDAIAAVAIVNRPATNQGSLANFVAEFWRWMIELLHDHTLFAIRAFHGFDRFTVLNNRYVRPFAGDPVSTYLSIGGCSSSAKYAGNRFGWSGNISPQQRQQRRIGS